MKTVKVWSRELSSKEIKKIVAKMVIEYQNSLSKEIKFSDVNTIYEIVKKY